MRGISPRSLAREKRKVKDHAFNSTPGSSHRGWRPAVAGKSLHPHAVIDQVNPERRSGHRRGVVAPECIRALSFSIPDPCRNVAPPIGGIRHNAERATQDLLPKYGKSLPQGVIVKSKLILVAGITLSLSAFAQTNSQNLSVEPMSTTPTFRVTVISRSVQAINYQHRSGSSKLDFAGTDLMPVANGVAEINSKRGSIAIEAEFAGLQKPTSFGNEYLTYVLWAISPEGRAVNLGEVLIGGNHRSKLQATTDLQAFALIVTAEPYYAVREPSNAVVLENVVRDDTKGTTEAVNAKYELMERGGYIPTGYKFDPVILNAKLPLEFFEARNALRIAQSEGADTYASDSYRHAVKLMDEVDADATQRHMERKPLIALSREAVQTAEDAREIAVKKMDEVRLGNERQRSADSLSLSRAQTDEATRQKDQAQSDQARAEIAKHQAESDADRSRADAASAQSAAAQARSDARS